MDNDHDPALDRSTSDSVDMKSDDIDQATATAGRVFHPHTLTQGQLGIGFSANLRAVVTPGMSAGQLRYESCSDLSCPTIDGYHVNVPLAGTLLSESGGVRTVVNPGHAVVYRTGADAHIRSPQGSKLNIFAMKFDHNTTHWAVEELTHRSVRPPIRLRQTIDLSSVDGQAWWSLVLSTYHNQLRRSLLLRTELSQSLARSIILGFVALSCQESEPEPTERIAHSPSLDLAMDFIQANAAESINSADIARAAGVSLRALQRGFKERLGTTPTEILRQVRMKRAHQDLLAANPEQTSVSSIAQRWGFSHYGRFAQAYRKEYGTSPSVTLRLG